MGISIGKRYNIFLMHAVFQVWPVLVRVLWIAAAIALVAPIALAEGNNSRPVSVGELNRQVERQDEKLDNLGTDVHELSTDMAALIAQVSALVKAVDKQGEQVGSVREELSTIYLTIVIAAVTLAAGLLGIIGVLINNQRNSVKSTDNNTSASVESQQATSFFVSLAKRPISKHAGRPSHRFAPLTKRPMRRHTGHRLPRSR